MGFSGPTGRSCGSNQLGTWQLAHHTPSGRQSANPATINLIHQTRLSVWTVLVVVLCCSLGLGAADTSTGEAVYRLQCPESCVCGQSEGRSEVVGVASINCSARALQDYALHIYLAHNGTGQDDDQHNGTSTMSIQPILEWFDLSHNNLTSVSAEIFLAGQTSDLTLPIPVKALDASYNAIQVLLDVSFENYTSLQALCLAHNNILNVSEGMFVGLESLISLDLSHNRISALSASVFSSLVSLRSLDLSHNQLQVVNNLPALSSLRHLSLQYNQLRLVEAENSTLLPAMPNLSYLDLSNNPLGTTQAGMFKTLPGLITLNMSACSISHLNQKFLMGVSLLRELRLDENNLTSLASPVFQNSSLTFLSLASMLDLANISHDAFLGLNQLVHLNLSHNPDFSFVQPNVLSPLKQLAQLDLSHCSISQLSHITFHYNKHLMQVYLGSNPFSCSCVNAWMAKELIANTSYFVDLPSLSCMNESTGQAQPINSTSFLCEEISLHNITSRISVKLGGQLLLRCDHNSSGQPSVVRWTTPGGKVFLLHEFHPKASSHLLTPQDIQPGADYHKGHYWRGSSTYYPHLSEREDRVIILSDGSLYIDYMLRTDTGPYKCQVSNAHYNKSVTVVLLVDCQISGEIQIYAIIVGFICALTFFALNLIYVIISWIARRLVNKRRREIIRQMLENMNAYKSSQITRIQENYTHQLGRVRNQYHMQRDRLHKNYTQQVTRMKRGCSNQVEKVRDNYTSRLAQLRDYSSNQIVQIRERANNQIVRIRDYGTSQLEKLRETYKLQHLHVMKLLDTMNLDNCRHIVETECMRAESMMFDHDLLGEDIRTDSPLSGVDSEYTTPDTSPAPSLEVNASEGLSEDMAQLEKQPRKKILYPARDSPPILLEMQTTLAMEGGLALDVADQWEYSDHPEEGSDPPHKYLMNMYIPGKGKNESLLQLQGESDMCEGSGGGEGDQVKENVPLFLQDEGEPSDMQPDLENTRGSPFMTPESSPTKKIKPVPPAPADSQGHEKDASDNETDL